MRFLKSIVSSDQMDKCALPWDVLSVIFVLCCAIGVRLLLLFYNWPTTNAEEGTFAIEALHIAFKGEWPIWMYGQNYMGVAESYVGAIMFHLFGVSIFSLRIGMLLFFSIFLVLVYLLGRSLYGHRVALVSLVFLIGATDVTINQQLMAVGGVEEMFVSGTLCMLLATWLVLSARRLEPPKQWKRALAYVGWGLSAGFGLWSHMLVVPFILCSALLLLIFCRREFLTFMGLFTILGLVIGASPMIIYNLHAPISQTTPMVLLKLYSYRPSVHVTLLQKVIATFGYTLPLETGMLHIDSQEILPMSEISRKALLLQMAWSLGYLLLLGISFFSACKKAYVCLKIDKQQRQRDLSSRYHLALEIARLMLILSAVITIASFAASSNSALRPGSFRYLSGLTMTNIVVLAPIVTSLSKYKVIKSRIIKYTSLALALFIIAMSIANIVLDIQKIPQGNTRLSEQAVLITGLKQLGIKSFYSGYWVCDRVTFQSQEDLTCATLNPNFTHIPTRYAPYEKMVAQDKNAAYVFTRDKDYPLTEQAMSLLQDSYQRMNIGEYIVFIPKKR